MQQGSRSIAARVLLPVLVLAAGTIAILLFYVDRVTSTVREDYDDFTLATATSHVATIFDLAASEVIALRLTDNFVVIDAKKEAVKGAIQSYWAESGLEGALVAGDGTILLASSRTPEATRAAVATCREERATLEGEGGAVHCRSLHFPLWDWTAVTFVRHVPLAQLRPELVHLPRFLLAGAVAVTAAVLLLFWRFLSAPISRMAADVAAGRPVAPTGLAELDRVGSVVNGAVDRLRQQTGELADELDRRHRVEATLREKEAHLRLLLDSTGEGIFGVDSNGSCTFCNPAAVRQLGFGSAEELLGRQIHQLSHHTRVDGSPYPARECRILLTSGRGPERVSDEVFWRQDGTRFPVEYWSCPVVDRGVVTGAVVGFIDITERQALEEQLRHSQKMEAVGRLAGGIAHDFNNLLTAIVGFATVAIEGAEPGSAERECNEQVLAAAAKATELTRQILAFSRKQVISPAPVELNAIIENTGKLLARVVGEDVEVVFDLAPGELVTMADRAQLEQVLMNLWTNARDAMPRGGRLEVATRAVECDAQAVALHGLEAPGRYALVSVADDGVGMDEETCRNIFEPFFTTKELGKGTGLGLSIVYGIVRQHHGQISVTSAPGRGTTFRIWLRLVDAVAEGPAPEPAVDASGGSETVLVAEDNAAVRSLVRGVLRGAGYRVLEASDGREALRLHREHADEIALCLFDVVMPHMGGAEALREIRARRPGARALLMSGYVPELAGDGAADSSLLLLKPFTPRELLRRVREALDA